MLKEFFALKKALYLLLCIAMLLSIGCSCGKDPQNNNTFTLESGTDLPSLFDDTAKSPLGQYDETTAFGIVVQNNNDGIVLSMQNKYFLFRWTDKSKHHYEALGVKLSDEVGVQFEVQNGNLIANTLELVQ